MGKVILTVTVDWEGENLEAGNIKAMELFNTTFPNIPLTHFICPAYFTRGGDASTITATIKKAIKKTDEIGLHIHCWDTLVTEAKVTYRNSPTWYDNNKHEFCVPYGNKKLDCGHGVPLGAYTLQEIEKIIGKSESLLKSNGLIASLTDCVSFRCGGWMACDNVLLALNNSGKFKNDASGAPSNYFTNVVEPVQPQTPLYNWVPQLWGASQQLTPDYLANSIIHNTYTNGVNGLDPADTTISQPRVLHGLKLHEIPDTGALADYASQITMEAYIQKALVLAKTGDVYISLGFHQESADLKNFFNKPRGISNIATLSNALTKFKSNTNIEYLTIDEAAQKFGTFLSEQRKTIPPFYA